MIPAKAIALTVRPFQVSHLCFEVGGILGESFTELGKRVNAFDFTRLYALIRDNRTTATDPGRLAMDSREIDRLTVLAPGDPPTALAALRAEPLKTALEKAIDARANAFYTRFENASIFIENIKAVALDKQQRLTRLSLNSHEQTNMLFAAYGETGKLGVVNATTSVVTDGKAKNDGSTTITTGPSAGEKSVIESTVTENTTVVNTDYGFRVPSLEQQARNERAQIDLQDEQLSHTLNTPNTARLADLFKNELALIDRDVNQLQIAYANTILLSPINGVVTGAYKNPGDPVSPGEPVFRVENNDEVLIVAAIVCRGRISIGSVLQVKTTLFDAPGPPVRLADGDTDPRLTLEAEVVAARGLAEDDQWEVIAKCSNLDDDGETILPLGYHFDYDNTEVSVL